MAPWASWPPDVPADSLEARIPQPGVLSQESSARRPQPGILSQEFSARFFSQESSARIPQPGVLSQEFAAKIPQPGVSSQSVWGPCWSHSRCLDSHIGRFLDSYIISYIPAICRLSCSRHAMAFSMNSLRENLRGWLQCGCSKGSLRGI